MTVHVTIEFTEEQKARLDVEADRLNVSIPELLVRASEQIYWSSDAWIAAVEKGRQDFEAGRVVAHEDVVAEIERRLLAAGAPPAE